MKIELTFEEANLVFNFSDAFYGLKVNLNDDRFIQSLYDGDKQTLDYLLGLVKNLLTPKTLTYLDSNAEENNED